MPEPAVEEYILLPERGLRARFEDRRAFEVLVSMGAARSTESALESALPETAGAPVRVIDSVHEDGPKLVQLDPRAALAMRGSGAGLRLEPIRHYQTAVPAAFAPEPGPQAVSGPPLLVRVVDAATRAPLAGVEVTAFSDFARNLGAKDVTDANGEARLALGGAPAPVERLYVSPPPSGFWGAYRANTVLGPAQEMGLRAIDFSAGDGLRHFYGAPSPADGAGVKVGVLDTGIDRNHPHLVVHDGRNTARGEPRGDFGDNGMGHGTHVAGIIAARGAPPQGLSGLAPAVTLYSFRVFGRDKRVTTNYEVVKAIIFAVEEGCDLLNLSLGGLPPDEVIRDAILDAGDQGVLVIASAGNDNRQPVARPASYVPALAVSAFGRRGSFPPGSYEEGYVDTNPAGADPADFMASFTNIGRDVFLTAPGVGILSTVPGGGYAPMSGTSMACPVVTGYAARLLGANPGVLVMPRDAQRTRAITTLLSQNAVSLGFPLDFEGFGRPK